MEADKMSKLTEEEKMALLDAFVMMEEWLLVAGHDWTPEEEAIYERALEVIGPIE